MNERHQLTVVKYNESSIGTGKRGALNLNVYKL